MPNFKISIITVVKNGMPFLKEAIADAKTVIKNTLLFYIYNDGTTEKYLKNLNNAKIIIKDKYSKNMYGALNLAVRNCSGDYIGLLHADDFFPNKNILSDLSRFIDETNADIIYGNTKFCKKENANHIIRTWNSTKFDKKKLKYGWMPPY